MNASINPSLIRIVFPLAPNSRSARSRSDSPARGPAEIALIPIPSRIGVLGITRTTRARSPSPDATDAAVVPAKIETTSREGPPSNTGRHADAMSLNICGLNPSTTPAPGRSASQPAASATVQNTCPNDDTTPSDGFITAISDTPTAPASNAPAAIAPPMFPAPINNQGPAVCFVLMPKPKAPAPPATARTIPPNEETRMATFYQLDFEKPLVELDERIANAEKAAPPAEIPALGDLGSGSPPPTPATTPSAPSAEVQALRKERHELLTKLYTKLSPWNTVRVARHPDRPQTRDYIARMCRDFCELHGDRRYGEDPAIVTGFGRVAGRKVLIVGHQKGRNTQEKLSCHFGCAHPEGYRKALAKMELAAKFGVPIVTLVDTPGAYPGLGAEERGQAEAIAVNMREMSRLPVPIVSIIIGEGGSGGALGIAVADRVAMLRNSWYSVISPEGCAAILWKQANEQTNTAAADALKLTARDNLALGIIDSVVDEPLGGAHRDPDGAARMLEQWIAAQLAELDPIDPKALMDARYARFRKLGSYDEITEPQASA